MNKLSMLMILISLFSLHAKDYPEWEELQALFGKEKDSKAVQVFAEKWQLKELSKGSSGSFYPENNSFSVMYRQSKIKTIIIDVLPPPKGYGHAHWTEYKETLPFGIEAADKIPELTKKFGKSKTKQGHTWVHKGYEIWVHFRKENKKISALYISKAD